MIDITSDVDWDNWVVTDHVYDLLEGDTEGEHQGFCLIENWSVLPLVVIQKMLQ